jgi:small subunit ribosomal protein S9
MAEGLFHATGKRKTAVARVWMKPGTGEISINKRSLVQYLNRDADQNAVMEPLALTDLGEKFDFYINVRGGGIAGQAGAIRHGISRALVDIDPALRDPLKKAGFLTRDSRMKERKKYGQPGARARFQYSKR